MIRYRELILSGLLMVILAGYGHAEITNIGVVGKTYSITERDALEEVEARAKKVNWKKEMAKIKPEKYRPKGLQSLPRVQKAESFIIDMTYTLDRDIPDGKGGVLYPRGYTFNPLDYMPFNRIMVVINPEDKEQVAWFKKSPYAGRIDTKLLISEGSYVDAAKAVGRPVFYAVSKIVDRFNLRAVPSIVYQEGKLIRVDEIYVPKGKRK